MTIVCIFDCLLVMILREYVYMSKVKRVKKLWLNPYQFDRAAVPPSENCSIFYQI
jgi:hypothetical protein